MSEHPPSDSRIVDGGDQAHAAPAPGTGQNIDLERSRHEELDYLAQGRGGKHARQWDEIRRYLEDNYQVGLDLAGALTLGARALMVTRNKALTERDLEVAVLSTIRSPRLRLRLAKPRARRSGGQPGRSRLGPPAPPGLVWLATRPSTPAERTRYPPSPSPGSSGRGRSRAIRASDRAALTSPS
jgi:hypothetical protein